VPKIAPGFTVWPDYEGIDVPVEVRTHPRARRLTLRVSRARRAVIVTLPAQCNLTDADAFLIKNIDWVRDCLDLIPKPVPFRHGAMVPLRSEIHRLVFTGETGGVVQRAAKDDAFSGNDVEENQGVPELRVGGNVEQAPQRFLDWLYEEVFWDLYVCVVQRSQRLGVTAPPITVRDQSSRWGSCSTTGALSFSWRLILAPPFVLDYLVSHEVAHLVHMDHSPEFWRLVDNIVPRMQEAKLWLQRYSLDLHRFGPVKTKRRGK